MPPHSLRKGSTWRRAVGSWFLERGHASTVRGLGFAGDDLGVVIGRLELSIECKNTARVDLAAFVDQSVEQAGPDAVPVLFVHRRGRASVDDAYVIFSGASFARLLEYLEPAVLEATEQFALWSE